VSDRISLPFWERRGTHDHTECKNQGVTLFIKWSLSARRLYLVRLYYELQAPSPSVHINNIQSACKIQLRPESRLAPTRPLSGRCNGVPDYYFMLIFGLLFLCPMPCRRTFQYALIRTITIQQITKPEDFFFSNSVLPIHLFKQLNSSRKESKCAACTTSELMTCFVRG
jgi:hypothetical protein